MDSYELGSLRQLARDRQTQRIQEADAERLARGPHRTPNTRTRQWLSLALSRKTRPWRQPPTRTVENQ
jgi:hypothetical protein